MRQGVISYGVSSYGYDRLKSNAMVSIGAWLLVVANVTWGFAA